MLSSFATATSGSSSWWKFNLIPSSFAAFATVLTSTNIVEKPSQQHRYRSSSCREPMSRSMDDIGARAKNISDEPLRILLFAESFPSFTSGITRRFKEILRRLAIKHHHIHVITGCQNARTWVEGNELLEKYVTFSVLSSTEFTNKIDCACPFLFPNPNIYSVIRRFSPDVVHIVEQTPAAMLCGAFAKSLDIPIVWSSHTNIDFYLSTYIRSFAVQMTRRIYQFIRLKHLIYSSMNLTVSKDFAVFMEHTGIPRPVIVWRTGVDSELFNPTRRSRSMRYRMFGPNHSFTEEQMDTITLFLCVGRISPEKNFEFLSLVLDRIPTQTFLCIIGDGPYRNSLEPIFPKDRAHFFGYLGGEELASAYASADYFIYASVSETFGQVYLESMASGTPVVAAEGGQLKEFFLNGEHGYLWKPDDLDSAETAIRLAMTNRHYLSMKARQQALNYSWDSASDQLNDIYHKAVQEKKDRLDQYTMNPLLHCLRVVYYGLIWLLLMLLALFFMAPFVRVSAPRSTLERHRKNTDNKYHPIMTNPCLSSQ